MIEKPSGKILSRKRKTIYQKNHIVAGTVLLLTISATTLGNSSQNMKDKTVDHVKHLTDFQVVEFRRYTIKEVRESILPPILKAIFLKLFSRWAR